MSEYKHYVRKDANGIVTGGFSDAFEQSQAGDIPLSGDFGRHFQINLRTERGQWKYKLVGSQITERTQAELDAEWNANPPSPPSLENRVKATEDAIKALMGI